MVGFDEFGDCWGGYAGPSVDLQDAFGISALESPETRSDTDTRRKATMMMAGDVYDYFWQDKGGFDYLRFIYDAEYGKGGPNGDYQSPTGANHVKHLYGNNNDHVLGLGVSAGNMYSGLATHILRLSDIYLVYAEAKMGLATSTTDQSALDAFNAVRGRAIPGVTPKTSITWEDVWKERRLELACEGDRWYDYVRLAYYDSQRAINELKAQRRDVYYSLGTTYKAYYENGSWTVNPDETRYNPDAKAPNVTVSSFTLPFPTEALAQRTRRLHQRCGHLEVGHGGVLDGRILPAGMLEADGAGGHHHVAGADIQIDAAAGTHPDKGVGADIVQLLHGDGGRGAADAGGTDGDLLPQQGAGVDGVLPILGHEVRVVKQGGDFFAAAGVAGQDHIPAHVALHTVDVKLFLQFLADFVKTRDLLLSAEIYGNTLMAEPYLPDQEITISVFADGTSLPIAERFAQKDGFAPTTDRKSVV